MARLARTPAADGCYLEASVHDHERDFRACYIQGCDALNEVPEYMATLGRGAPAIHIDQVAELDTGCGLIGGVGDDDFGALNRRRLSADGVDVRRIRVLAGKTAGTAFVTYRGGGERDFIYHIARAACAPIDPAAIDNAMLAGCSLFPVPARRCFPRP